MLITWGYFKNSDSVPTDLRWGILNKSPGHASAASPRTTVWLKEDGKRESFTHF